MKDDDRSAGYGAVALRHAGYKASELQKVGFDAYDLVEIEDFTALELKEAGYSASQLIKAASVYIEDGYNTYHFIKEDFIKGERDSSYNFKFAYEKAQRIEARYSHSKLKEAGYSAYQLIEAASQLKERVDPTDMGRICEVVYMLERTGYNASELKLAGYRVLDLLVSKGYDLYDLREAGYSETDIIEGASECRKEDYKLCCGSLDEVCRCLRNRGYSYSELVQAGFCKSELKYAGFRRLFFWFGPFC